MCSSIQDNLRGNVAAQLEAPQSRAADLQLQAQFLSVAAYRQLLPRGASTSSNVLWEASNMALLFVGLAHLARYHIPWYHKYSITFRLLYLCKPAYDRKRKTTAIGSSAVMRMGEAWGAHHAMVTMASHSSPCWCNLLYISYVRSLLTLLMDNIVDVACACTSICKVLRICK